MTFNIGSQSGGVINNVAGDQHNAGAQHGTLVTTAEVCDAAAALRAAVEQTELRRDPAVVADVHALQAEVNSPAPDRRVVADRLHRITSAAKSLGALMSAGVALAGPLRTIAAWLG
jgi:hypothetical protein